MAYLRVSLTDRCNLRCRYCLPADARFAPDRASGPEMRQLMQLISKAVGVTKIRLTGGEPTLAPDIHEYLRLARSLVGDRVGLTTNGVGIADRIKGYQQAGMNLCNISIDAANADDFAAMTRRDTYHSVIDSIVSAAALPGLTVKLNAVAIAGFTDAKALIDLAIYHRVHLRFIEVMAIGTGNDLKQTAWFGAQEIRAAAWQQGISLLPLPEKDEPTSRVWSIPGIDPNVTTVGFITTSSQPFCGTCDRLRLSSQGTLHTCLFDETGIDLLTPLRQGDDAAVIEITQAAVAAKKPQPNQMNKAMAAIGG